MTNHFTFHRLLWLVVLGLGVGYGLWPLDERAQASPTAAITLSPSAPSYSQSFDTLGMSGPASTMPDGWKFMESGTSANSMYYGANGTSNTGDTYSYGNLNESERALGALRNNSLSSVFGGEFVNGSGSATLSALAISYTGEEWRLGTANREDRLDFQYSTNATSVYTGTWIDADELDFFTPYIDIAGPRNGNNSDNQTEVSHTIGSLSIPGGATFWIRWVDFNVGGAEDGLSVDDFSITATFTTPGTPTPLAAELSSFEAHHVAEGISVTWETASENDTLGFHLWRGINDNSPDVRLNDELIPAQAPGGGGASYQWIDEEPDGPVYYWLDIVDWNGEFERHGPVSSDSSPTSVTIEHFEANPFPKGVWVVIGIAGLAAALLMTSMRRKPR